MTFEVAFELVTIAFPIAVHFGTSAPVGTIKAKYSMDFHLNPRLEKLASLRPMRTIVRSNSSDFLGSCAPNARNLWRNSFFTNVADAVSLLCGFLFKRRNARETIQVAFEALIDRRAKRIHAGGATLRLRSRTRGTN
jgi:hypothetical protein